MLETLVIGAGWGQLALAAGSTLIPRVLDWPSKLRVLPELERRLFWVYGAYILVTNVALGLVSLLLPGDLVGGTPLAVAVTAYAAVYWVVRVVVQLTWFRGLGPQGTFFVVAEVGLLALFLFFSGVFVTAAWGNAVGLGS